MPALLFLARFLQRPLQVASVIPSSPMMVRRVAGKMDFSRPVVVAEYGPGEGCHTREMLRRAHPDSKFLLFELDPEFCRALEKQFANDRRVSVINADCATLPQELAQRGLKSCDYILSGIPFSYLDIRKKREILRNTYRAVKAGGAFIIYQVTNELKKHATAHGLFERATSEWFPANVPPMFITVFHKDAKPAAGSGGSGKNGKNGHRNNFGPKKRRLATAAAGPAEV